MAQIFIADAHTLTREGVKALLAHQKDFHIAGEARDSKELFSKIRQTNPDVVIIDFHIPGHFSIDDIAMLRNKFPRVRILVITTNQNKEDILKVLEYSVNGYLLKECDEVEVISAIYAAIQKEKFFCGRVMDAILEKATHHCPEGSVCHHCQAVSLSEREVEIIRHIAEGDTTKVIAQKLFLSFHTITTHRKNIFKKLNVRNSTELVLYAVQQGIVKTQSPGAIKC